MTVSRETLAMIPEQMTSITGDCGEGVGCGIFTVDPHCRVRRATGYIDCIRAGGLTRSDVIQRADRLMHVISESRSVCEYSPIAAFGRR